MLGFRKGSLQSRKLALGRDKVSVHSLSVFSVGAEKNPKMSTASVKMLSETCKSQIQRLLQVFSQSILIIQIMMI